MSINPCCDMNTQLEKQILPEFLARHLQVQPLSQRKRVVGQEQHPNISASNLTAWDACLQEVRDATPRMKNHTNQYLLSGSSRCNPRMKKAHRNAYLYVQIYNMPHLLNVEVLMSATQPLQYMHMIRELLKKAYMKNENENVSKD